MHHLIYCLSVQGWHKLTMHLRIITIGKNKNCEFIQSIKNYIKQTPWEISLVSKQLKHASLPKSKRMQQEAELMLAAATGTNIKVALDENGKQLNSDNFAQKIQSWQLESQNIAFFIGGADGLAHSLLNQCDFTLSLGKMVWPHQMVQLMLIEQIYRAYTIINNHPYHRS